MREASGKRTNAGRKWEANKCWKQVGSERAQETSVTGGGRRAGTRQVRNTSVELGLLGLLTRLIRLIRIAH
jgi:hypothetical protein